MAAAARCSASGNGKRFGHYHMGTFELTLPMVQTTHHSYQYMPRKSLKIFVFLLALLAAAEEYDLRLHDGWNLISVTRQGTTLSGLGGDAVQLPGFCLQRGRYVPVHADDELRPGLGYWVFSTRDLRSPQNSDIAPGVPLVPAELHLTNLSGQVPGATLGPFLNDLAFAWKGERYRAALASNMQFGLGYALAPDAARAQLAIGATDPASPTPGQPLRLIVTGASYLAAGGVVWFDDIPMPIMAHSASSVSVLTPAQFGANSVVLDAGHGIISAAFPLTIPSSAPTLNSATLRAQLQTLVATVDATLSREHPSVNDANIAAAQAQLLALDDLLGQFLSGMSSARRDQLLLLLENQDISNQLSALDATIANRIIDPPRTFAAVRDALTSVEPHDLLVALGNLRTAQLTGVAATGELDDLLAWATLDVLARIVDASHSLTDWTPSIITGFRVDDSACDLPNACDLRYFADFAIAHDSRHFQAPGDAILTGLARELVVLTACLPADFTFATSANQIEADAATQVQLAVSAVNDPALSHAIPAPLLRRESWTLAIDISWMAANGRGYLDPVFSQKLRDCDQTPVHVQENGETVTVFADAPGFARLDASIFNRQRERVFTANFDLSIPRGVPTIALEIPLAASDFLFQSQPSDNVDAVSYTATVVPAPPLSVACFTQAATATLEAEYSGVHFTTPSMQISQEGIEFSQSYLLEPGSKPFIAASSFDVYAGTTTTLPISVFGFNFGGETIQAQILLNDKGQHFTFPFELPLESVFNNAITVEVEQSQHGTVEVIKTAPLEYQLRYTVANTPGLTDVVTVVTGIDGIGSEGGAIRPNATVQDLHLAIIKAPLLASMDADFAYDGFSVNYAVHRGFGVELLPEEEAALNITVDPPNDIIVGDGTISVLRDAEPVERTISFTIGSETVERNLMVIDDVLSVFLFSELAYTDSSLEFFYTLESGAVPALEDVIFDIVPADDLSLNSNFIEIGANAEAGERVFKMYYGAKSASATFTVAKDQLEVFASSSTFYEGGSVDLTLFRTSGNAIADPVIAVDPSDDVSIDGTTISFAFGAAPGDRTVTVTANGMSGETTVTVLDDSLLLAADSTGAFPGSSISFTVTRASGTPLEGQPTLAVTSPDNIVVNGLTLQIAESAAPGVRTVTATLGNDSVNLDISVLGDAEFVAIDLSAGANALSYPISRLNALPDPLPEVYKTSSLLLRRVSNSSLTMGSPASELGRFADEIEHTVTFSEHYYIGVFEVTQRQFELVTGTRPSSNAPNDYETLPVDSVSYEDIRGTIAGASWPSGSAVDSSSFLGKIRARTGLSFDLPTEAQWENACRAGTTTALNNGSNLSNASSDANLDLLGRYSNNSSEASGPVGDFLPNAIGIYDMHGNVWEWCLDWYADYGNAVVDPKGGNSGSNRVLRSGSYLLAARYTRSANRGQLAPSSAVAFLGFRLAGPGSIGLADQGQSANADDAGNRRD